MHTKYTPIVPLLLSCAALLAGCSQQSRPATTEQADSANALRIAIGDDPQTLDPRQARNLENTTILHMLYEGLMRINLDGKLVPALVDNFEISKDSTTYTFKLKRAYWSNGEPVTSNDFEKTWKSLLAPGFPAPNAYQFYVIKGAKAAKEGRLDPDSVGIHAPDPSTLVVELERPTPYFLELLATQFYLPVYKIWRDDPARLNNINPQDFISNGPFQLKEWSHGNEMKAVKNPHYWDADNVALHNILLVVIDENTALRMYESGELDWIGSPLSAIPQDAAAALKQQGSLKIVPGAGTHWFRFNTARLPFNNVNMRKAFSYALDRKAIVDHVTQGNQFPATGILPPPLALHRGPYFPDNDITEAWSLFQRALDELDLSIDELPGITLCYASSDRNKKIAQAVQQQWQRAFGITINLESCESKVHFEKLSRANYQISSGSWFADFRDPISFLEIFKHKDNGTNNTQWENLYYAELLDKASLEMDPHKRKALLEDAEKILINDMPVAPLFFSAFNYVKADNVVGVHFSELGYLDFKDALVEAGTFEDTPD